jgi:hypothetical protein
MTRREFLLTGARWVGVAALGLLFGRLGLRAAKSACASASLDCGDCALAGCCPAAEQTASAGGRPTDARRSDQ